MSVNGINGVIPVVSTTLLDRKNQQSENNKKPDSDNKLLSSPKIDIFAAHQEDLTEEDHEDSLFLNQVVQQKKLETQKHENYIYSRINTNRSSNTKEAQELRYLSSHELTKLAEYLDDAKLSFKELDALVDELAKLGDIMAENKLAVFFDSKELNLAQIYLALNYIAESLLNKYKIKKRLRNLVMGLLSDLESQESAYLFEFFALAKHPSLKGKIGLINGMAALNSGNLTVTSVKQMLGFIRDSLNGEFDGLVSSCLRKRVHILERLNNKAISFEDKTELAEYLAFEKNLIAVNSIYLQIRKFKEECLSGKKPVVMTDNYLTLVSTFVNFAESLSINELAINNMYKQAGISSKQLHFGFLNRLIELYNSLPNLIYNDNLQIRQKIIDGLRNAIRNYESASHNGSKFAFIKKDKLDQNIIKYEV